MSRISVNALSDADVQILREIVARERGRRGNTTGRRDPRPSSPQAPEVYIIRTPSTGIGPAFGVSLGYADCEFYTIVDNELEVVPGSSIRVHNLCSTSADGNAWGLAIRDKAGKWVLASLPCTSTPEMTGTGTDQCPCDTTAPSRLCANIAGLTAIGATCNADLVNGGVTLTQTSSCVWESTNLTCSSTGGEYSVILYYVAGTWYLLFRGWDAVGSYGYIDATYTANTWDCSSTLTLTKVSGTETFFSGYPSTITVDVGTCSAGTGTGTGGGGTTVLTPCCVNALPETINFVITDTGSCSCLDGLTGTMLYDTPTERWSSYSGGDIPTGCGPDIRLVLDCNGSPFSLSVTCPADGPPISYGVTLTTAQCDPFLIVADIDAFGSGSACCTGTAQIVITE